MTYLLKYYVSAFTNTKSDHTLPIRYNNFTRWDAVLRDAQDIVWQFTLLHIAESHDKKSEYCHIFSPVYWFWATACDDRKAYLQLHSENEELTIDLVK